jgi:hypothetical protein
MKNHLAPILSLTLAACIEGPVKDDKTFVNECDDPAIRAQFHEAVQEAIEAPICIHTVYPDEAKKDSLEKESTDDDYSRIYVEDMNAYMAGPNFDAKIAFHEFAKRDVIVDEYWGNSYDYSDAASLEARHDLAASNNTEGCMNWYVLQNGVAWPDTYGAATLPDDSPEDNYLMYWGIGGTDERAHEAGHAFGLLHTFETEYAGSSLDYPDDPYHRGDLLADTAIDPGTDYCHMESGWEGEGDYFAVCESPYEEYAATLPMYNPMSYYSWGDDGFTPEQVERMQCTWARHEANIYSQL